MPCRDPPTANIRVRAAGDSVATAVRQRPQQPGSASSWRAPCRGKAQIPPLREEAPVRTRNLLPTRTPRLSSPSRSSHGERVRLPRWRSCCDCMINRRKGSSPASAYPTVPLRPFARSVRAGPPPVSPLRRLTMRIAAYRGHSTLVSAPGAHEELRSYRNAKQFRVRTRRRGRCS